MFRFLLRMFGVICLGAAFVLFVYDATRSLAGDSFLYTNAAEAKASADVPLGITRGAAGVRNSRLNAPLLRSLERVVDHARPILRLILVRSPFGIEVRQRLRGQHLLLALALVEQFLDAL